MLATSRFGETGMTEIEIEHLNYGKLVVGPNGRVPSSEGYGVTRRSKGLSQFPDTTFLPPRLLDIKKFERDFIDEAARKEGCLLLRTVRDVAKVVIMRARFRSEDGEDGTGRPYQQTAIWVVRPEDWALFPAEIVAEARKLEARPDIVGDSAKTRLEADPLRPKITQHVQSAIPPSAGAKKILNILLPPPLTGETGEDRSVSFGNNDFPTEAEFLGAVGEALSLIRDTPFGRWQDICIASGLRHDSGGLFVRYLPSDASPSSGDVPDHDIRRRLDRLGRARRARSVNAQNSPFAPKETASVKRALFRDTPDEPTSGARQSGRPLSAGAEPIERAENLQRPEALSASASATSQLEQPEDAFLAAMDRYRKENSAEAAAQLVFTAARLAPQVLAGQRGLTRLDAPGQGGENQSILQAIVHALRREFDKLTLGGIFDVACLSHWICGHPKFAAFSAATFDALRLRLGHIQVLLPQELSLLSGARIYGPIAGDGSLAQVFSHSQTLKSWLHQARQSKGSNLATVVPEEVQVLQMLADRLQKLFAEPFHLDGSTSLPTGIHGRCIVSIDALLSPADYGTAARQLILAFIPEYVSDLHRRPS
jgi:hypothetical protein